MMIGRKMNESIEAIKIVIVIVIVNMAKNKPDLPVAG